MFATTKAISTARFGLVQVKVRGSAICLITYDRPVLVSSPRAPHFPLGRRLVACLLQEEVASRPLLIKSRR